MKQMILGLLASALAGPAFAQSISISASDMPVTGDQLLHSNAAAPANFSVADSGTNKSWDFSASLTPINQTIDTYKTAIQAGYIGSNIGLTAYGYKVTDTLSFPGAPASAKNVYTFFNIKSSPSRFVAEGFGAQVVTALATIPIAAGYSAEDTIYQFPLTYGDTKTSTFKLTASIAGLGSLSQQGTRKTRVDGWGTIKTPYFTTPVAVIRVRSEVDETDTVTVNLGTSTTFTVPRHYVEYKWLAKNEHYPALIVNTTIAVGTETPTTASYRDLKRSLGVSGPAAAAYTSLQAYPNPATSEISVSVPAGWQHFTLRVYDLSGRMMMQSADAAHISTVSLASGRYIIIADSGAEMGICQFVK